MCKKIFLLLAALSVVCLALTAGAHDDVAQQRQCAKCGMDRKIFDYSRMVIRYGDGTSVGVCSLHCAVVDLDANKGRAVTAILVSDRNSRILTDATKAVWVLGGKKQGVMTPRAKWAFASRASAQAFVDEYGGKVVVWDDVLAAERKDAKQ